MLLTFSRGRNRRYNLKYDDGDEEEAVTESCIRAGVVFKEGMRIQADYQAEGPPEPTSRVALVSRPFLSLCVCVGGWSGFEPRQVNFSTERLLLHTEMACTILPMTMAILKKTFQSGWFA